MSNRCVRCSATLLFGDDDDEVCRVCQQSECGLGINGEPLIACNRREGKGGACPVCGIPLEVLPGQEVPRHAPREPKQPYIYPQPASQQCDGCGDSFSGPALLTLRTLVVRCGADVLRLQPKLCVQCMATALFRFGIILGSLKKTLGELARELL